MMVRRLASILISGLLTALPAGLAEAGQVEYFSTGVSNPTAGAYAGSIGFGVSNNGVAVGTTNLGQNEQAFTYTTGATTYALGVQGRALSISSDGTKASGYFSNGSTSGAMAWDTGTQSYTHLNTVLGFAIGSAISPNGLSVVGYGSNQMVSWNSNGTNTTLLGQVTGPSWQSPPANFGWAGAVSDTGLVGGTSGYSGQATSNPRVAVIANVGVANSTQQLGNGVLDSTITNPYGKVLDINTNGTFLVGESSTKNLSDVVSHAFLVDRTISDTLIDISLPLGFSQASARSVSDNIAVFGNQPLIVGTSWNGTTAAPDYSNMSASIWVPGSGALLLSDYATSAWGITFAPGFKLITAYGISTSGQYITGSALDSLGNQVGYILTTNVPEPASVISLGLGIALAAFARSRSRKRRAE
ncbi:MAG: PEP-CTERM sorting domain-containing protein [Planctomycetota bacterium]|nr:MAG: PEP-CTERM sorting domain-containing protein [Planctomycetota bacterium]